MKQTYSNVTQKLENMSIEEINTFLQSYSSQLGKRKFHCKDLVDLVTGVPFITSILGSGLTVTNNTTYNPTMSEEIHQKAQNIIAHVKGNSNHNYSQSEIMFALGYIELYYKKGAEIRGLLQ
ncbi:hypothetical protein [Cetobacterium sp.]|uniref:hypothetical protein n=1 Tax=Cetobacterium sp. TaxID=2071632 RepID=UPI003F3F2927